MAKDPCGCSRHATYGTLKPVSAAPVPVQRNRLLYALAAVLVVGTGLLWRSGLLPLPSFLVKYGGDSLWALVVFLCFGFAFNRGATVRLVIASICFTWSVEFLQLYHAQWIDMIRATLPGRLVLGASFNAPDLIAYVVGIGLGAVADCVYLRERKGASGAS